MHTSSAIRLSSWTLPLVAALILLAPPTANGTTYDRSFEPVLLLPDSRQFVARDAWNSVALYRLNDRSLVRGFRANAAVSKFAVTADEGTLLLGCGDGTLSARDLTTGRGLWALPPSRTGLARIRGLCFSHDGRSVVVVDHNDLVLILEAATGRQRGVVQCTPRKTYVQSAALSPDGSWGVLVTFPGNLMAFDVATGRMQDTGVQGASHWPARYSAGGKHVAFASDDRQTRLRIVRTGGNWEVQDLGGYVEDLDPIKPTADGGFLVTISAFEFDPTGAPVNEYTAGVRWRPGRKELEELWRLPGRAVAPMRMDFDPERLIGVRTHWNLVTDVIDLKTGTVLGSVDNRGNSNPLVQRGVIHVVALLVVMVLWVVGYARRNARRPRPGPRLPETDSPRSVVPSSSICVRLPDTW
jgi:hypothetical protein